jgi:Bacterial regulatory proteins, luxR family
MLPAGARVAVEISSAPLMNGERVVGVFGLFEGRPDDGPTAPPHLTPRQVEVPRLLEQGRSTNQIAAELHLGTETVRNHIRRLFRASASTPDSKPSPPRAHHPSGGHATGWLRASSTKNEKVAPGGRRFESA